MKSHIHYIIMGHNSHQESAGREGSDLEGILEGVSVRSAGKFAGTSTRNKRKEKTPSPTKQKGKSMVVQEEKKSLEGTPPSAKKIKIRSLTRKKTVSLGTKQY